VKGKTRSLLEERVERGARCGMHVAPIQALRRAAAKASTERWRVITSVESGKGVYHLYTKVTFAVLVSIVYLRPFVHL